MQVIANQLQADSTSDYCWKMLVLLFVAYASVLVGSISTCGVGRGRGPRTGDAEEDIII